MPVVNDYPPAISGVFQFLLGTSPSLLMGPGTAYEIARVEGLDMPPVRPNDWDRIGADGVTSWDQRLAPRTVLLDVEIHGTPGADLADKVSAFVSAWQSRATDVNLTYRLPGTGDRRVTGRPRRCRWSVDRPFEMGIVTAAAEFFAPDPAIIDVATGNPVIF